MATISRTADFLGTLGVQTHIPYTDGGYADLGKVAADLAYVGITAVRDGISDGLYGSASLSSFIALAKQGVTFTIGVVDGSVTDTASLNARLALVQRLVQAVPGSVTAVEGANEINNWPVTFNGVSGLQGAIDLQKAIYAAVHGNPVFAGIKVDYFTGYGAGGLAQGPDPSTTPGLADNDTQHPYPQNGDAPAAWVNPTVAASNEVGHTGSLVYTETGYSTAAGKAGAVDQATQAKYTLDLLFDDMKNGVAQTDLYELMDAYAPGSPQGDDGFGLFDSNGNPKPVATALHNLHAILADTGSTAATFQTGSLSPTVTGLPATGNSLVLEKSSGVFDIVLWAEPKIWNATTSAAVTAPAETVTVELGAAYGSIAVYDPLAGSTAIATAANARSIQVALTDHPLVVEVSGLVTPPTVSITSEVLAKDTGSSASDGITSNGAVTLSGTVTGAAGTVVQILDGKTALGTATIGTGGAWTYTTVLGAGTHSLGAVATDLAGEQASAVAAASITVITVAPSITLATQVLSADAKTVTLGGTVAGAAGTTVSVSDGTHVFGAATLDGKGGWSYAAAVSPGTYHFTATATDLAGNTASVDPAVVVPAAVAPVVATPDTLVVTLAEDAYKGDALFTISVDGKQVGGTQAVTALNNAGQTQSFTYTGAFGAGAHTIGINFLNDAYGGTQATDRNLYVKTIALDGFTTTANAAQYWQGLQNYSVGTPVQATGVLSLKLSEDAYLGDAQFTVSVNGTQVGGVQTVSASHAAGQTQTFSFAGVYATGTDTVTVNFLNDLYKGTAATDRNLYVNAITLNGTSKTVNAAQMSQGAANYSLQTPFAAATQSLTASGALALRVGTGETLILDKTAAGAAVTMAGPTGTLTLSDAAGFSGTIAGFAAGETLDLASLGFGAKTTLAFAGSGQAGVLIVSDGASTAHLALSGSFSAARFHLGTDNHGGTAVTLLA